MNAHSSTFRNPSWWDDSHSSAWERTKEALRRDWEQTKADLSDGGRDLNQDAGDTIAQAAGKQSIPAPTVPNAPDGWDDVEPAVRYGYGARQFYGGSEWNTELEDKMRGDWEGSGHSSSWERVKSAVRRGWEGIKRTAA